MESLPVEMVERKGIGHPDTLTDRAAEEVSIYYSNYCLNNIGRILHHNVDKAVLVGGQSKVYFGGGEIKKPMKLHIVGRAIGKVGRQRLPVKMLVQEAGQEWSQEVSKLTSGPDLLKLGYIRFSSDIRPGSVDLVTTFETVDEAPLANDTSFGVGFWPLSQTEKIAYETEQWLNSPEMHSIYPQIGNDIKVMAVRRQDEIRLTLAIAFIADQVRSAAEYFEIKRQLAQEVKGYTSKFSQRQINVEINTADKPGGDAAYLTVTGSSAECGDDGQIGRGNRANGLITPYRPMSLEATAGKNPVSHVGKIYNVMARLIAKEVYEHLHHMTLDHLKTNGANEVYCYIVSQIGKPINRPQIVDLEVRTPVSISEVKPIAEKVAEEVLNNWAEIQNGFLSRKWELF
jgi:S-adenosylmethionine synthetase